jgi:hypothetical protein
MTATVICLSVVCLAFLVLFLAIAVQSEALYWLSVLIFVVGLFVTGWVQA